MKTTTLNVIDVKIYDIDRHCDKRGYFQENHVYNKCPSMKNFLQTNISLSHKNVLRGLHVAPFAKLCTCLRGRLYDVVADVRSDSKTYGKWFGTWLTEHNCKQLYIPAGCAHGFFSGEDNTILHYSQDGTYDPTKEFEIDAFDLDLGIDWPNADEYLQSKKDENAGSLSDRSTS